MNTIEFFLGSGKRPFHTTRKQRILANLYKMRFISKFVKKPLKNSYNLDTSITISRGFHCETPLLHVGKNTGLSNIWIHGTGEVNIGKYCSFSENCKIITGEHDLYDFNRAIEKSIKIEDYVWVATGSSILQGITIGRGAVVGAFSVVKRSIPPYAIVFGNPCKIIGFRYTPEEAVEFEKLHYKVEERIPLEKLQTNYEKYFLDRIGDIKRYVSI